MTTRNRDQSYPNGPGLGQGSSSLLSTATARIATSIASPAIGASQQMEQQHASPASGKGSRSRQMLESLLAENLRLKAEMEAMQSRNVELLNKMVTDLVANKSELAKVKLELARHSIQKSSESQQEMAQMMALREAKQQDLREKDKILNEREFEVFTLKGQLEQEQQNHVQSKQEKKELQMLLNEQDKTKKARNSLQLDNKQLKIGSLVKQQDKMKKSRHSSQLDIERLRIGSLQQEMQELKNATMASKTVESAVEIEQAKGQQYFLGVSHWKKEHSEVQSQIQNGEMKPQLLTHEPIPLQETHQKVIAETKNKLQTLEQCKASHAIEIAEACRFADFLKRNCENTSRRVKELEATILNASQMSMANLGRDHYNAIHSGRIFDPPGAWQS